MSANRMLPVNVCMRGFFGKRSLIRMLLMISCVPRCVCQPPEPERLELAKDQVQCVVDTWYDPGNKDMQLMADICYPSVKVGDAKRAAVVVAHGLSKHKRDMWIWGERVLRGGRVVMNIEYRTEHCDGDITQAVRWLRGRAEEYNIDPARIGLFGYSYGAMCATWAALSYAGAQSVAVLAGAMKVQPWWSLNNIPPFLFMHATDDPIVPIANAHSQYSTFIEAGADAQLVEFAHGGHTALRIHQEEIAELVDSFFNRTLGASTSLHRIADASSSPVLVERQVTRTMIQRLPADADSYSTVVEKRDSALLADYLETVIAHFGGMVDASAEATQQALVALARWALFSGQEGETPRTWEALMDELHHARWALSPTALQWVSVHHTPPAVPQQGWAPMKPPMGAAQRAASKAKALNATVDIKGYKSVVELKCSDAMAIFIGRTIDAYGGYYDTSIEGNVLGLARYYSGEVAAAGFQHLLSELKQKRWALAPAGLKRAQVQTFTEQECNTTGGVEAIQRLPLNDRGYLCAASVLKDEYMAQFIQRVIENGGGQVDEESKGRLMGLAHWYSGENGVQDFPSLIAELHRTDWALAPAALARADEKRSSATALLQLRGSSVHYPAKTRVSSTGSSSSVLAP